MEELQIQNKRTSASLRRGTWEIELSDPSVHNFGFGSMISDKYLMTDIKSPLGQNHVLYNTVRKKAEPGVTVELNLEEIDQTLISALNISGSQQFFDSWNIILKDNRTQKERSVTRPETVSVYPAVELNKLKRVGFEEGAKVESKSLFELIISKK